jgi:uncharacterized membrane protein (DUF373 family)
MSDTEPRAVSEQQDRSLKAAGIFRNIEHLFYVAIAVALAVAGAALFVNSVFSLFSNPEDQQVSSLLLGFIDGMLLVFIVTELIHTVRAVIAENVLMTEPFLIVGIVAAVRRLIVISAEAQNIIGGPQFQDAILEMAVLVAAILGLGLTIFLLRHTTHPEPRPAHEPGRGES